MMEESKTTLDGSEKVDGTSLESQQAVEAETEIEYPTKFKLVMVVVALVLSMFLVSQSPRNAHVESTLIFFRLHWTW